MSKTFQRPRVLFLGGGRRVSLAELFRQAGCEVIGYELDTNVPLALVAPVEQGRAWSDPGLVEDLRRLHKKHDLQLIVPLDCAAVAAVAKQYRDPIVVCSLPETAETCLNKQAFESYCLTHARHLYPVPRRFEPAVLKPCFGFGSRGIRQVMCLDSIPPNCIAQRKLTGREYSVDAYFNRFGGLVGVSPRERLRVAGGEVLDSQTVENGFLSLAVLELAAQLQFRGPVCFQFMEEVPGGSCFVTECNARFGGGATLSIAAGLDMVHYLLEEYVYDRDIPNKLLVPVKAGLLMKRAFRDVFFTDAVQTTGI